MSVGVVTKVNSDGNPMLWMDSADIKETMQYQQGKRARRHGLAITTNPCAYLDAPEHSLFRAGWLDQDMEQREKYAAA